MVTDKFPSQRASNAELWYFFDIGQSKNSCHFEDDIFICIFFNEKFRILFWISLKIVLKISIDNKSALVQVMAWLRAGDKPLPELMLAGFTDAYMRQ